MGTTHVMGKDRATARALLAACDRLGVDQAEVRTNAHGFDVPDEVADEAAPYLGAGAPEPPNDGEQF